MKKLFIRHVRVNTISSVSSFLITASAYHNVYILILCICRTHTQQQRAHTYSTIALPSRKESHTQTSDQNIDQQVHTCLPFSSPISQFQRTSLQPAHTQNVIQTIAQSRTSYLNRAKSSRKDRIIMKHYITMLSCQRHTNKPYSELLVTSEKINTKHQASKLIHRARSSAHYPSNQWQ